MLSKFFNVNSKLQMLISRSTIYKVLGVILILEVALFSWSYSANYNPVTRVSNRLPISTASAPGFLTNIYAEVRNPLKKPMAVTVIKKRIYVADTNNKQIQVFDYTGNPLMVFGSEGKGKGQFSFPYGIAGDASGLIYVADLYNSNVSIFNAEGKFVKYLGEEGDFGKPSGLAIDGDKIYVADALKNQVMVYSTSGEKLLTFGATGDQAGLLQSPNALTHANGKIYVTDTGNDRVQVFDEQGKFLLQFNASNSPNTSLLANPRGIAVNSQGVIYVVSNLTGKVFAFNQKGEVLYTFGSLGLEDNQFQLPNGLTIDDQGRLYVTDTLASRISVYQI